MHVGMPRSGLFGRGRREERRDSKRRRRREEEEGKEEGEKKERRRREEGEKGQGESYKACICVQTDANTSFEPCLYAPCVAFRPVTRAFPLAIPAKTPLCSRNPVKRKENVPRRRPIG